MELEDQLLSSLIAACVVHSVPNSSVAEGVMLASELHDQMNRSRLMMVASGNLFVACWVEEVLMLLFEKGR